MHISWEKTMWSLTFLFWPEGWGRESLSSESSGDPWPFGRRSMRFQHLYIFSNLYLKSFNGLISHYATWIIRKHWMHQFNEYILIARWCLSAKKLKHLQPLQQRVICHHHHHMTKLMACLHPLLLISQSTLSISSWERSGIFGYKNHHTRCTRSWSYLGSLLNNFLYSLWCRPLIPSRLRASSSLTCQLATSLLSER